MTEHHALADAENDQRGVQAPLIKNVTMVAMAIVVLWLMN